jgi:decaprenyl-diphosphate synthase subunit 1
LAKSINYAVQSSDEFVTNLHQRILAKLKNNENNNLYPIASYYFDGKGKSIRPHIVNIISQALLNTEEINENSMKVGMIAEMIHTASLIHDDVIDKSDTRSVFLQIVSLWTNFKIRRGKEAANVKWGVSPAVMAGNYIIAVQSQILASFNNDDVSKIVSKIIEDLIHGELCQMESIESTHLGRYEQYLNKTYLKTASLIANSCEAVAVLTECDLDKRRAARDFGKLIGLAFQIQDDRLDFISDANKLGKPACADLKLGLSTAPVLFASELKELEMIPMMSRRFSKNGDVERAYDIIRNKSDALLRTRLEAEKYARLAERVIPEITSNPFYQEKLRILTFMVTNRDK